MVKLWEALNLEKYNEYINNITISKDSTYYLKESLGELFLWKENRLMLIISMQKRSKVIMSMISYMMNW